MLLARWLWWGLYPEGAGLSRCLYPLSPLPRCGYFHDHVQAIDTIAEESSSTVSLLTINIATDWHRRPCTASPAREGAWNPKSLENAESIPRSHHLVTSLSPPLTHLCCATPV